MVAAPFGAVMGGPQARQLGAGLGQKFIGSHGLSGDGHDHDQTPFELVGVLAPTGAVLDRLIVTPAESVWAAHGIPLPGARDEHDHDHDEDHAAEAAHATHGGEPDVTALLVKYRSTMAAVRLPRMINDQAGLQAAVPAVEMTRLLALLGVGLDAVRAFAILLMATSGLSIFVALYSALRQREGDMAMLRVMGARPAAIFASKSAVAGATTT
ncbi:MAG TPA: hypothetical protein PKB04_03795, partial [Phenylobacterium sp.]|nr:hypothetical protein [Phenylobacterium sp.]